MDVQVHLPDIGESDDEITISFWIVDPGERVKQGDDLVEVVTGKASFTVPAPEPGIIGEIMQDEGDIVQQGDVLCTIRTDDMED